MSQTFRDVLLDHVCQFENGIRYLLGFCVTFLLFMVGSMVVVESGSATYVVAVLNIVGLAIIAVGSGIALFLCQKNKESN